MYSVKLYFSYTNKFYSLQWPPRQKEILEETAAPAQPPFSRLSIMSNRTVNDKVSGCYLQTSIFKSQKVSNMASFQNAGRNHVKLLVCWSLQSQVNCLLLTQRRMQSSPHPKDQSGRPVSQSEDHLSQSFWHNLKNQKQDIQGTVFVIFRLTRLQQILLTDSSFSSFSRS